MLIYLPQVHSALILHLIRLEAAVLLALETSHRIGFHKYQQSLLTFPSTNCYVDIFKSWKMTILTTIVSNPPNCIAESSIFLSSTNNLSHCSERASPKILIIKRKLSTYLDRLFHTGVV